MTGRKSQLSKFNAKWSKNQVDQAVLKEKAARKAIEENDLCTQGEKVMEEMTKKSEEVFAVIARSGMEAFIKTWNNSMESVVRETVRAEMNSMRTMIREEMESAMSGMFQGMNEAMANIVNGTTPAPEPVRGPLSQRVKSQDTDKDLILTHVDGNPVLVDNRAPKMKQRRSRSSVDWNDAESAKTYMFVLLTEAVEQGADITSPRNFKTLGGKFNTAYQKGLPAIFGKGKEKTGTWGTLIELYYQQ